jgi:hypothetical protein
VPLTVAVLLDGRARQGFDLREFGAVKLFAVLQAYREQPRDVLSEMQEQNPWRQAVDIVEMGDISI